jgi:NADPH-dependent 2,4-dienoyl-CoA reductase/sulfur reductase-like enzyme
MADYLRYLQRQVEKSPARVLLNTECTKEMLDKEKYDALIIAIGADPIIPKLPGIDKPHVYWAPHADAHEVPCGEKVVIVGAGAVGIEAAIDLKKEGKDVTVIEMLDGYQSLNASASGGFDDLMAIIKDLNIPIRLSTKLTEVTDSAVVCTDPRPAKR